MSRKMICHYEMLEVERDADDDTIKKNYRKLALKWHPDKNLANENEAKVKFQLIQQAYEVLSDPQERAWYDRHREQILKGRQDYADDSLDVYAYFNSSCYKGFGDDEQSFYTVYRGVFEKLAAEDIEYMEEKEFETIPAFGNSKSDLNDVVNFYGHWESYSTKKTFYHLFPHDISEIRERRVLKLIDKEHKKIQQKARKERNEEVRSLVLFVKKRDRRMAEYRRQLEEKAEQNRLKSQQNRLEQIKKRSAEIKEQQKNSKVHKEQEEQLKALEQEYLNQYSDSDDDEDYDEDDDEELEELEEGIEDCEIESEDYNDELYCVACNKSFNSVSAKANHEGSKKHKQNVELLKSEMNLEEENYQKNLNGSTKEEEKISEDEEVEEAATLSSKSKGKKSKKKKGKKAAVYDEPDHSASETKPTASDEPLTVESEDDDDWGNSKKGKKSKSKGKSKPEKTKEAPKAPEEATVAIKPEPQPAENESEIIQKCATCNQVFPSKNKLFTHLKATNHSIYLNDSKQKTSEKLSTKKKR